MQVRLHGLTLYVPVNPVNGRSLKEEAGYQDVDGSMTVRGSGMRTYDLSMQGSVFTSPHADVAHQIHRSASKNIDAKSH